MYGETFYGRHTAQNQLQWRQIKYKYKNTNISSFKSNEHMLKKVDGPYYVVSDI